MIGYIWAAFQARYSQQYCECAKDLAWHTRCNMKNRWNSVEMKTSGRKSALNDNECRLFLICIYMYTTIPHWVSVLWVLLLLIQILFHSFFYYFSTAVVLHKEHLGSWSKEEAIEMLGLTARDSVLNGIFHRRISMQRLSKSCQIISLNQKRNIYSIVETRR